MITGEVEENGKEATEITERMSLIMKENSRNSNDYFEARDGDHLLVPFECDICIFRKLRRSDPKPNSSQDELLLQCIRRMNLDTFWSRARSTLVNNSRKVGRAIELSKLVGLEGSYEHSGPYPFHDHCGYEVAINMLLYSKRKGRHDTSYTQFETIRQLRSSYSNHCRTTPDPNMTH